jgi:hypothetical protein
MRSHNPSFGAEDQFAIDASAFTVEVIPDTGIKLLRAKPETEPALSRQLSIPRRLELLRRCATESTSSNHTHSSTPPSSPPQPSSLQDVPIPGSSQSDSHFLQDVQAVGETSRGETVFLVLSVVTDPLQWNGGWFIGIVPPDATEAWQAYLAGAREAIVAELQRQTKTQP